MYKCKKKTKTLFENFFELDLRITVFNKLNRLFNILSCFCNFLNSIKEYLNPHHKVSFFNCTNLGLLYIGGVKQEIFRNNLLPTSLYSRNGYEGCMASIVIEDKVYDLMALDPQIINRPDKSFKRGCNGYCL